MTVSQVISVRSCSRGPLHQVPISQLVEGGAKSYTARHYTLVRIQLGTFTTTHEMICKMENFASNLLHVSNIQTNVFRIFILCCGIVCQSGLTVWQGSCKALVASSTLAIGFDRSASDTRNSSQKLGIALDHFSADALRLNYI